MRAVIRLLADMGVLARPDQQTMPLRANNAGEEMDLELLIDTLDLIRQKMRDAEGTTASQQPQPQRQQE